MELDKKDKLDVSNLNIPTPIDINSLVDRTYFANGKWLYEYERKFIERNYMDDKGQFDTERLEFDLKND